jgi:hypothetical protein
LILLGNDNQQISKGRHATSSIAATFTQISTTNQWQINSADGLVHDIITLSNNASVHASDYMFV